MLSKYFTDLQSKLVKKKATAKKSAAKTASKKTSKGPAKIKADLKLLTEKLSNIIPAHLAVEAAKPIDASGFSPEGADLIVYRPYCNDLVQIMGGYIPCELIYGTIHVVSELDKTSLADVINKVATVKKLDKFSQAEQFDEDEMDFQSLVKPAIIIAYNTDYSMLDLKNDIVNYYMAKGIEHELEFDLLIILNKGIYVKEWKEKRSFYGFETGPDSMMWSFILINEYIDVKREDEIDYRKYVRSDEVYKEY
ncbi:MAG: hypothetical protein GY754_42070 [bacterium]|nr:hypothetical protein [bacterium]